MRLICRLPTTLQLIRRQQLHTTVGLLGKDESSSSDSSDSDESKSKNRGTKVKKMERNAETKQQTLDLLNSLLTKMSQKSVQTKTVDRAIPKKKLLPKKVPEPTLEEKLTKAAEEAATTLGGDGEKTKSDLLDKIFSAGAPTEKQFDEAKPSKAESSEVSLNDLLKDMKIDRTSRSAQITEGLPLSRTARVQELAKKFQRHQRVDIDGQERGRYSRFEQPANLFGGQRLMIFNKNMKVSEDIPKLNTWEFLEKKEFKLLCTHPPENIFQEMIQWTERGLLWKFPIDNEIGMEEEQNNHFSEHVFIERHLQDWCPKKGPIRHFMELVCVGLSKNPYMTIQEKKDHIMWYKNYFGDKQVLLKEIGALDKDIITSDSNKQIETQ